MEARVERSISAPGLGADPRRAVSRMLSSHRSHTRRLSGSISSRGRARRSVPALA